MNRCCKVMVIALPLSGLAATTMCAQTILDSVKTATGYCDIWQAPPGLSDFPSDASYSPCALDRKPRRLSGPDIPAPRLGTRAGGMVLVVVKSDGTVDSARSGAFTATGDTSFDSHIFDAIRQWRYELPTRDGKPVRAAWSMVIVSDDRNDTLPSHMEWRYVTGTDQDSAVATWVVDAAPPPFSNAQIDTIYTSMVHAFRRMHVIVPASERQYCLIAAQRDAPIPSHLQWLFMPPVTDFGGSRPTALGNGCERDPRMLRFVLPEVHRTENDRFVVLPSGDFLPAWPPGFDAQMWRGWTGRCVGHLLRDGSAPLACEVHPIATMAEQAAWYRSKHPGPRAARPWQEGDSVRFTVLVSKADGFLVDTLHYVVPSLDSLGQRTSLSLDDRQQMRAASPAATIRPELRRPESRGNSIVFRILMDHGPADMVPVVLYTTSSSDGPRSADTRRLDTGMWSYRVSLKGDPGDVQYLIYLVRPTRR